jgi:hypothetical protein
VLAPVQKCRSHAAYRITSRGLLSLGTLADTSDMRLHERYLLREVSRPRNRSSILQLPLVQTTSNPIIFATSEFTELINQVRLPRSSPRSAVSAAVMQPICFCSSLITMLCVVPGYASGRCIFLSHNIAHNFITEHPGRLGDMPVAVRGQSRSTTVMSEV